MTETEIANLANDRIGGQGPINDFHTDNSVPAQRCRRHYEPTRKSLLRSFAWPFASKDVALSQDTESPLFKWTYQYILPSDYLRLLVINEQSVTDAVDSRFEIKGRKIQTNYDTCNITYVRNVTTVDEFDPLFVDVLVLRLAVKMLPSGLGTKSSDFYADLINELRIVEYKARCICSQENNTTGREEFNNARYGN